MWYTQIFELDEIELIFVSLLCEIEKKEVWINGLNVANLVILPIYEIKYEMLESRDLRELES